MINRTGSKLRLFFYGSGLLIVAILFLPSISTAQDQVDQVRVTVEMANIRNGPSTNERILLTLTKGTILKVITKEENWFEVQLTPELQTDAESGFIHESTVERLEEDEETETQAEKTTDTTTDTVSTGTEPSTARPDQSGLLTLEEGEEPGPIGVGLHLWVFSGLMANVHYDINQSVTLEGNLGLYKNVYSIEAQALYRYRLPTVTSSGVRFELFGGGGLNLYHIKVGEVSDQLVGLQFSAGTFLHLNRTPLRFSGTLRYVNFNISNVNADGFGLTLGIIYFLAK